MAVIKRMTAQSKVNIKAAKEAIIEQRNGRYVVELVGITGKSIYIQDGDGDLVYSSMASAKKAVTTHNDRLRPDLKSEI